VEETWLVVVYVCGSSVQKMDGACPRHSHSHRGGARRNPNVRADFHMLLHPNFSLDIFIILQGLNWLT
jgi:hypothetical protein